MKSEKKKNDEEFSYRVQNMTVEEEVYLPAVEGLGLNLWAGVDAIRELPVIWAWTPPPPPQPVGILIPLPPVGVGVTIFDTVLERDLVPPPPPGFIEEAGVDKVLEFESPKTLLGLEVEERGWE